MVNAENVLSNEGISQGRNISDGDLDAAVWGTQECPPYKEQIRNLQ